MSPIDCEFYKTDTQARVTRQKVTVWIWRKNYLAQLKFSQRCSFLVTNRLLAELDGRYDSYQKVQKWFNFLKERKQ